MKAPYLYGGLEASLYDSLDELSGFEDVAFYRWFAAAGNSPILDLGCGTGRLMRPLLAGGLEVVGLDASPEMLAVCRTALLSDGLTADLRLGDLRDFDFGPQRFGTVMIPGYSIQLLLEEADLLRCLACCRRHLAQNGQLILSTYLPWEMVWDGRPSKSMEERKRAKLASGGQAVASQGWAIDTRKQLLRLDNRFERFGPDGTLLEREDRTMTLRWDLPHDMLRLLGKAGFSDVSLYGDYSFEPPEEDSESILYVARR